MQILYKALPVAAHDDVLFWASQLSGGADAVQVLPSGQGRPAHMYGLCVFRHGTHEPTLRARCCPKGGQPIPCEHPPVTAASVARF